MLTVPRQDAFVKDAKPPSAPRRFIALAGDTVALAVLAAMSDKMDEPETTIPPQGNVEFITMSSSEAFPAFYVEATPTDVLITSDPMQGRRYRVELGGSTGYGYVVRVQETIKPDSNTVIEVGLQLLSFFTTSYDAQLEKGVLPSPPPIVSLPVMRTLLERLHGGPHFGAIINKEYASKLPPDWPLSYGRVSPTPLEGDPAALTRLVVDAFSQFEEACLALLERADIQAKIGAGVDVESATMLSAYLADSGPFNVRRLDLVALAGGQVAVTENDEMPGGLPDAYHNDWSYQINQGRWQAALGRLFASGPVVFLVSTQWSKVYLHETAWFADHLRELGYDAHFLSTDDAHLLEIRDDGVTLRGQKIGTIYRTFPIFEAVGHLANLVQAAQAGLVEMTPQFSSLGNKVWMAIFWEEQDYFRHALTPEVFRILQETIPYAEAAYNNDHIVESNFPRTMVLGDGTTHVIESFDDLLGLPTKLRDHLVLKAGGANTHSARMYGVIVGSGTSTKKWREMVAEMFGYGAPVIFQRFRDPVEFDLAVLNVLGDKPRPEYVKMRALARPWSIYGQLVTMTCFAAPGTKRLHGTTHSCQVPTNFG